MLVFESLDAVALPDSARSVYVAVGTFDGVHRGHQSLLTGLSDRARRDGGFSLAFTFRNHPRCIIDPESCPPLLTPWPLKRRLLERLPLDCVVAPAFDESLRTMAAEAFVEDVLVRQLRARRIHSGGNFRFGHDRRGGPEMLAHMGQALGFAYEMIESSLLGEAPIASTRVRHALADGRVEEAADLMARPHQISGTIVQGDARGRTIGFPTANVSVARETLLPADGVYAGFTFIANEKAAHPAMMNVGFRPTVSGRERRLEVHLLGFSGELVGKELTVQFAARLRGEQKFPSLEELRGQLQKDNDAATTRLAGSRPERY